MECMLIDAVEGPVEQMSYLSVKILTGMTCYTGVVAAVTAARLRLKLDFAWPLCCQSYVTLRQSTTFSAKVTGVRRSVGCISDENDQSHFLDT